MESRPFAIIFILGPPGAGKGTICAHLAETHNLAHYSVGDGLRSWMRENRGTPLALRIQDKLDNQGFLPPEDLNPFIGQAIKDALARRDGQQVKGILIDGCPRYVGQMESLDSWPFGDALPLVATGSGGGSTDEGNLEAGAKPDVVLCLQVSKEVAEARYVDRARDGNDSREKFERRFEEYEKETKAVEEAYRRRGVLLQIDGNGTKEGNVRNMEQTLMGSMLWQRVMVIGKMKAEFLVW